MRLDKFISQSTTLTRSLAKKALNQGNVTCNDVIIKQPTFKVCDQHQICLNGQLLSIPKPCFIMLNKPVDTLCSTIDEQYPSVLRLLNINSPERLHIAGRLDVDTTGLVLLTSDGQWSHRITSPKKNCNKRYRAQLTAAISDESIEQFAHGIQLHGERSLTKPAKLEIIDSHQIRLTITEGKYHQVKRMFAAIGNKVVALHRESIGDIELDHSLMLGQWRYLSAKEIASV